MDNTYQAPQGRLLPSFVLFVFVLAVLYTLFLLFQQYGLKRDISQTQEDLIQVEADMASLQNDQIEELVVAQELKDTIAANTVFWSKVVDRLDDLTPVSVFFSSYSASEDGSLQLSGLADNNESVSDVISVLERSRSFDNVFVPSLTVGTTADGQQVVSFSLQVDATLE